MVFFVPVDELLTVGVGFQLGRVEDVELAVYFGEDAELGEFFDDAGDGDLVGLEVAGHVGEGGIFGNDVLAVCFFHEVGE